MKLFAAERRMMTMAMCMRGMCMRFCAPPMAVPEVL